MPTALVTEPPEIADADVHSPREPTAGDARAAVARISRLAQVMLGLLWLLDGALQFQPYMFGKTFITGVLLPNAAGQPRFIAAPIIWIAHLIEPHVALFNGFAATLQALIGLGLLYRRTVKPALLVSFVWALGIWFSGEGLGMIFTGNASPLTGAPGAALLYVLVGLMCWPRAGTLRARTRGRGAGSGLIGERGMRLTWAGLWLGSAALWLSPANDGASAVHDAIATAPSGVGWLSSVLSFAARITAGQGTTIAVALALLSATIGVAVLRSWHAKAFLGLAIAISVLYWIVGQGLGGVFTGQATDVSTAPLMILIAAILLARGRVSELGEQRRSHRMTRDVVAPDADRSGRRPTRRHQQDQLGEHQQPTARRAAVRA